MGYKIITYRANVENPRKTVIEFQTAVETRDYLNKVMEGHNIVFEIYNVEKWDRQRLNQHAQLEEECAALGKE